MRSLAWAQSCGFIPVEKLTPQQDLDVCESLPETLYGTQQAFQAAMQDWAALVSKEPEDRLAGILIRLNPQPSAAAQGVAALSTAPLHFFAPDRAWSLDLKLPPQYQPDAQVEGLLLTSQTLQPWPETKVRINAGSEQTVSNGSFQLPLADILPAAEGPIFVEVLRNNQWEQGECEE